MFASLFPHNPQFIRRQVATFHNQWDYIFLRFYRYILKSEKKVGIQELWSCFTLKLRCLQKGSFDSKYGDYSWVHTPQEMGTRGRRVHLQSTEGTALGFAEQAYLGFTTEDSSKRHYLLSCLDKSAHCFCRKYK